VQLPVNLEEGTEEARTEEAVPDSPQETLENSEQTESQDHLSQGDA
jgi:hypothetical protein